MNFTMTTPTTFIKLKNINQNSKDIVFGYIRQQCKLLAPQLIKYLCLIFYHSKWDKSKIDTNKLKIEGNKLTWTDKCEQIDSLTYKVYEACLINDKCFQWTFKIHQIPECRDLSFLASIIGVRCKDIPFENYDGFSLFNSRLESKWKSIKIERSRGSYGQVCNTGDIIIMKIVNNKNNLISDLQFKINDTNYGTICHLSKTSKYTVIVRGIRGLSLTVC